MKRTLESFRDWGRDCYCPPGHDNTCNKRFDWQLGDLPFGYDHKYIYSHVGYNLKATEMQAAIGSTQLSRVDGFIAKRRENFATLDKLFEGTDDLILPFATPGSEPSWFGYPITLHPDSPVRRVDLLRFLDSRKIGSRLLFVGHTLSPDELIAILLALPVIARLRRRSHSSSRTPLLGIQIGVRQHLDHAGDADHRGADLVAHRRQERALGVAGVTRARLAVAQRALQSLDRGEVGGDRQQADHRAGIVAHRRQRQQHRQGAAALVVEHELARRLAVLGHRPQRGPIGGDRLPVGLAVQIGHDHAKQSLFDSDKVSSSSFNDIEIPNDAGAEFVVIIHRSTPEL